jgi:hypothetical protein
LFVITVLHTHKLQYLQAKSVLIDKAKRPEEMDVWLKSGRKFHAMPDLTNNAAQFGAAWVEWWSHLQPEWRGKGPVFSTNVPEDASWTELQKGGANGFFLILLSYCWWGSAVLDADGNEIEPTYSQWLKVFRDIEWVLESMVKRLDQSLKRVRKEVEGEPSRARKRYVSLTIHVLPF